MIRLSSSRYRRSPRTRESPKQPMPVKSQIPNRLFLGVALAALFWLPEGDRLANVLAGAERIQDESGDVGSRNRRRDRTRADACSVAASAWAHCQAGRANDGVIEATLANGLLLLSSAGFGMPILLLIYLKHGSGIRIRTRHFLFAVLCRVSRPQ